MLDFGRVSKNALITAIVVTAGAVAVGAWIGGTSYVAGFERDAWVLADTQSRNVGVALANEIDALIAQADDTLIFMRRRWVEEGAAGFARLDQERAAIRRMRPLFDQLVVFGVDGRIRYTTPTGFVEDAVYADDAEHFYVHARAPNRDELHIGRPFFGRVAKRWHVQVTRPILDSDGVFVGVIAASIRPERFAVFHRGIDLGPDAVIAVIRNTGEFVTRTSRHDETVGRAVPENPGLQGASGETGFFTLVSPVDGVLRRYAWQKVTGTPLVLLIGQSVAAVEVPVAELRRRMLGWYGAFVVVSGLITVLLVVVVRQRYRAATALAESERRFHGVFEKTNTGIVIADGSGVMLECNEAFAHMLDYELTDAETIDLAAMMPAEDRAADVPLYAALLQGGRNEFRAERRFHARNGRLVWVDMSVTAVRDDRGRVQSFIGSAYDITERKLNELELARSNEELAQFGYVASHDLRQPLRMITSYLRLLERNLGPRLAGDDREFFGYAMGGAIRMEQMLVSLLEYSRVGRMGEPLERHDVGVLFDEAKLFVGPDILLSGAEITAPAAWPEVMASRNEMVRLFQNLLSNALKYRLPERAPHITVSIDRVSDDWQFTVTDDGIGIPAGQVGRLFKVFQRLHGVDEYEGTGVGLAVCRKIVERHGGTIRAESPGLGQGSSFIFTLPADLNDLRR